MVRVFPYLAPPALIALATGLVALVRVIEPVDNTAMLYLLAVMASAVLFGSRTAILTAIGSFFAFNFFFVEPHHTFTVAHEDEWVALSLLLITGVITGQLAAALGERAQRAEQREKEAVVLYDVVRLVSEPAMPDALQRLAERLRSELDLATVVISLNASTVATAIAGDPADAESGIAPRIMAGGSPPTDAEPARPGRWIKVVPPRRNGAGNDRVRVIPVRAGETQAGSISLVMRPGAREFSAIDDRLLSAVAHQLGQTTERLRLQREATDAEVLRRTDSVRSALLNAVSHDLRTPLASIIATGGNLLERDVEWTEEERRSFVESIVMAARRLDRLVGTLLDLSRIEAGALVPHKALHDLPSLINEVAGQMEFSYPAAKLIIEAPEDLPPVPLDYVEIGQVLANLLENAVLHGGGEVRISVSMNGADAQVAIQDSGPGIPEEAFGQLFRPFSQITSDGTAGAGLGLAVASGFISAHNGRIWAENCERGARFVFTLPLAKHPVATNAG